MPHTKVTKVPLWRKLGFRKITRVPLWRKLSFCKITRGSLWRKYGFRKVTRGSLWRKYGFCKLTRGPRPAPWPSRIHTWPRHYQPLLSGGVVGPSSSSPLSPSSPSLLPSSSPSSSVGGLGVGLSPLVLPPGM